MGIGDGQIRQTRLGGCCLVIAGAGPAHALLLNTGDDVILNLDFTGASPPPPYDFAGLTFDAAGNGSGSSVFFGGLDATGGQVASEGFTCSGCGFLNLISSAPGVLDGIFSVELIVTQGSLDLTNLQGEGIFLVRRRSCRPSAASAGRPNRRPLRFLGIGIAGIGFSRRKRKQ